MSQNKAPNFLGQLAKNQKPKPSTFYEQTKCSLSYQKACCGGTGFLLENKGMFAHAQVCPCVKNCSSCKGRMLLVTDGSARPCKKPSPIYLSNLINEAKIPSRYTFAKLANFANNTGNCQSVVNRIKNWELQFKKNHHKGLVIHGPVGVGKTFILAALAKNFVLRGISVKFVDFFQLITQIKASYTLKKSEQAIIEPLMDVDILIIDELGKGRNNDFELTILDQIIMGRYNQNKILIASTNYPLESQKEKQSTFYQNVPLDRHPPTKDGRFSQEEFGTLESRIDKRIMSRLKETAYFLNLTGDDYRETKGQQ